MCQQTSYFTILLLLTEMRLSITCFAVIVILYELKCAKIKKKISEKKKVTVPNRCRHVAGRYPHPVKNYPMDAIIFEF